jgi:hypothetical protein
VPINLRSFLQTEERGADDMTKTEKALAIRKAPMAVTDPAGLAAKIAKRADHPVSPQQKWKWKLLDEERARRAQQP